MSWRIGSWLGIHAAEDGEHVDVAARLTNHLVEAVKDAINAAFGTDLMARITTTRMGYIDTLATPSNFMANVSGLLPTTVFNNALTSARLGYIDALATPSNFMANISALLTSTSFNAALTAGRLQLIDSIANVDNFKADISALLTSSIFNNFWTQDRQNMLASIPFMIDYATGKPTINFVKYFFQEVFNMASEFSIQTSTDTGAYWVYGEIFVTLLDKFYLAMQEYITEGGSISANIWFNLPSGKTIQIIDSQMQLIDFRVNLALRIQSITIFGVQITLPDIEFRGFPELIWKAISFKLEWLPDINKVDIYWPNSENWVYGRGDYKDNPQVGTAYNPVEKYGLFKDGLGKDGAVVAMIVAFGWAIDQLGFENVYEKFIKKIFNIKNLSNANTAYKSFLNTKSLMEDTTTLKADTSALKSDTSTLKTDTSSAKTTTEGIANSVGSPNDTEQGTTLFAKALKNFNKISGNYTQISNAIEDIANVEGLVGTQFTQQDLEAFITQKIEEIKYKPYG